MQRTRTDVVRLATAAAVEVLVGERGATEREAAWRSLPDDADLRAGDLPALLLGWASNLKGDEVSALDHAEPFEIVSIISIAAGINDPLGEALTMVGPKLAAARAEEEGLAEWVEEQKIAYRAGRLSRSQIKKLEALPGWTWD